MAGGLAAGPAPPGTVQCPHCHMFTKPGIGCEFCSGPLAPATVAPGAGSYAPGGGYAAPGYGPPPGRGYTGVAQYSVGEAFFRRFAASFIDGLIIAAVTVPLRFMVSSMLGITPVDARTSTPEEIAATLGSVMGILAGAQLGILCVFSAMMASSGQTPGKKLLGLQVVGPDGDNPSFFRALWRETVAKWLSSCLCAIGYLWMLWDPDQQAWHDKLAATTVVSA